MAITEAKDELVLWSEFRKPVSDTTQKRIAVWNIHIKE
jgi:hypothetical protein|tara:strand:+ start:641 stop:754 length:114 start_codon:yes stop_codon:yes gene_type:complete